MTTSNGYTVSSRCERSAYRGIVCSTQSSGNILGARQKAAPVDLTPNTNPDWGINCRSCAR